MADNCQLTHVLRPLPVPAIRLYTLTHFVHEAVRIRLITWLNHTIRRPLTRTWTTGSAVQSFYAIFLSACLNFCLDNTLFYNFLQLRRSPEKREREIRSCRSLASAVCISPFVRDIFLLITFFCLRRPGETWKDSRSRSLQRLVAQQPASTTNSIGISIFLRAIGLDYLSYCGLDKFFTDNRTLN